MRHIFIIFKKELKRFFLDPRMLLAMFLPGVLIFVMYTFMGNLMHSNLFSTEVKDTTYQIVYTDNYSSDKTKLPLVLQGVEMYLSEEKKNNKAEYTAISVDQFDEYKAKLQSKEIQLLIVFTDGFEENIFDPEKKLENNISIYYNAETNASSNIYSVTSSLVQGVYNNYTRDMEDGKPVITDVGKKNILLVKIVSFILPMITVSLLYATITSFCPESISGEKERGTLASMLLTPIKRSEFILGKIMALGIIALASGSVSFVGLVTSLPKMMGLTALPFTAIEIILLFFIMITTLLLFVSFGVLISSLSNTVKEAGSYLGPLSAVFMFVAIIPTLSGVTNIGFAFIPVLNLSACMGGLLNQTGNLPLLFTLTVISNLLYTALCVFAVTRLFNKEKVILGH